MNETALVISAELRDELAANDRTELVDPRSVPGRFSTLKQFARSPLHYWWAVQRGWDETLSMRIGSGCHAILFGQPWVLWTGKVRNGAAWEAFKAEHAGKAIMNAAELRTAQDMADAIRASQVASAALFAPGTLHELRIDWEWEGRKFRSTPDAHSHRHLVDLKCLRSANPEDVQWQSRRMHYHAQAALYRRSLAATGKPHVVDCYLVVVENKPPHPVTTMRFTPNALDAGDRLCALWFERMRQCEEHNSYPGYVQSVVDLDLPITAEDLEFEDDDEQNGDE